MTTPTPEELVERLRTRKAGPHDGERYDVETPPDKWSWAESLARWRADCVLLRQDLRAALVAGSRLQSEMTRRFGSVYPPGPHQFLRERGYVITSGYVIHPPPGDDINGVEEDCIDFLVFTWGYGFDPTPIPSPSGNGEGSRP